MKIVDQIHVVYRFSRCQCTHVFTTCL